MPLHVVDDAPPFRDLVVIGISEPNMSLGDQPLNQLACLRPTRTGTGGSLYRVGDSEGTNDSPPSANAGSSG
jgi:hypothetical protein